MTAHAIDGSIVSAEFARSWLLVSGSDRHLYRADADVRVIDLEDGVVAARRQQARRDVVELLRSETAWVRINPSGTPDCDADIEALRASRGLSGVMLAKSESPAQIAHITRELPGVPIVALIESALGIERAYDIATTPGTLRLAFGKGDYRRDTLTANDPGALSYARGRLVNASRAAGLQGPIDGPCLTGMPDLADALRVANAAGMTGMLCLDREDVSPINVALSPSASDLAWAEETIASLGPNGEHVTAGCDLPLLASAKRIQEIARIFRIRT